MKMLKNYTNIFFELLSNSHSKSYMCLLDSETQQLGTFVLPSGGGCALLMYKRL